MRKSGKPFGHELKRLFPIWLFFFLAFGLLRLTQSVVLRGLGVNFTTPSLVLVCSLIVAKAYLILDWFRFVARYNDRPLIVSVIWKSGIYYLGTFVVYVLEQLIEFTLKHHNPSLVWERLSRALVTPRFWIIQLWLVLLMFAFTATRETIRALGKSQFMMLWFGSLAKSFGNNQAIENFKDTAHQEREQRRRNSA
jgi:hypothetical protein